MKRIGYIACVLVLALAQGCSLTGAAGAAGDAGALLDASGAKDLALAQIESYAASQGVPLKLRKQAAAKDKFDDIPPVWANWKDANGQPVNFPLSRVGTKTVTETVGADNVATVSNPTSPVVVVPVPEDTVGPDTPVPAGNDDLETNPALPPE